MNPLLLALAALALAALGFCLRRTAPPIARWAGLVVAIAMLVVAALAPRPLQLQIAPRVVDTTLQSTPAGLATALLAAAAQAGPRAVELTLRWSSAATAALSSATVPTAALGAVAVAPPPLPFALELLRLRCVGECAAGRPLLLEVDSPAMPTTLPAQLSAHVDGRSVFATSIQLGEAVASASFVPQVGGPHRIELQFAVDSYHVVLSGEIEVAPAEEVIVVEQGSLLTAALRAQGVAARAVTALPADWHVGEPASDGSLRRTVVLAAALPAAQQAALVAALGDGLGLFVLGSAFGDDGSPLRAVLPVRPLPAVRGGQAANAAGGAGSPPSDETPSPRDPPPPPSDPLREPPPSPLPPTPPPPSEPIGATGQHGPVSDAPIEVDKHAVALVLVVDRSGSMGTLLANGHSKMSYAKTSALRTATALTVGDAIGLVTFGNEGAGRVEMPLTDAQDMVKVREGIERLRHGPENTYLLSGLRQARKLLLGQRAAVKHVVVLSDGEFVVSQGLALSREARLMCNDDHVTVSVIAIVDAGTDAQFRIEAGELAKAGGGEFVPLTDPSKVPSIVSSEVTRALAKVGRKPRSDAVGEEQPAEQPAEPPATQPPPEPKPEPPVPDPAPTPVEDATLPVYAVADSPLLAPDPSQWPRIAGLVPCEAPLDARVLLVAGDEGLPLLAFANRGLGRIGALAADLSVVANAAAGSTTLRDDAAFPAWLAQWVRAVAPSLPALDARGVDEQREVAPPVPTPHELAWFEALAAAPAIDGAPPGPEPVSGAASEPQIAASAGWLLVLLLLLAVVERAAAVWSVRRGRTQ